MVWCNFGVKNEFNRYNFCSDLSEKGDISLKLNYGDHGSHNSRLYVQLGSFGDDPDVARVGRFAKWSRREHDPVVVALKKTGPGRPDEAWLRLPHDVG